MRQTKAKDASGLSYLTPATPLEALRTCFKLAATVLGSDTPTLEFNSDQPSQISTLDLLRALFNAMVGPMTCRKNPNGFITLVFRHGLGHSNLLHDNEREVSCSVYSDDLLS